MNATPIEAQTDRELVAAIVGSRVNLPETFRLADAPNLPVKARAKVEAAIALGRRTIGERPTKGARLASASDVYANLRARYAQEPVENFIALALDVRHRLISETIVARGSLTGVDVHPRDVFRPLIAAGAAAVIFAHNHPSGDPTPSRQDIDLTARLRQVGELCGIAVLDHVVLGAEGYASCLVAS